MESKAAVMNVHSLAFQMTPRCNLLQKQLSLYFRSKHAPKSLFALFNECGYVNSYPWSTKALKVLSNSQMEKMKKMVLEHTCFWSYDNLRLSKAIKAQRGDQHTVTDNGTAMTVIQIPDHVKEVFMREAEVDVQRSNTELRDESETQPTPSMEEEPVPQAAIPVVDVPQVAIDNQAPPGLPPAPVLETPDIAQPNPPSSETPSDEPHMLTWDNFYAMVFIDNNDIIPILGP
ncbi:hypothetical protein FRC11_008901 [Ceratobasidium sp. 423]|nr:hypothetical protein FRC11_008901 [Ceratobasidium sp. 423]